MTQTSPTHLGIILDGNRRWAKSHGLKTIEGHREGAETFKKVSLAAFERGVKYLSAFVFSTENWQRAAEEVSFLMKLVIKAVELHLDEYHKRNIRIVIIGEREGLDKSVLKAIERTEQKTADNTAGTLVLCFNYGGKQEIANACKQLIIGGFAPQDITPDLLSQYMYEPSVPEIDLLIRTSGEHRTSGFMLWRADYAELYFVDKYWPDFSPADLDEAFSSYANRDRRFGK